MKKIFYTFLALYFINLSPCLAGEHKNIIILNFSDFGPPSMSYHLLGQEWWQWEAHGDSKPGKYYDVKVIVYRNTPLDKVKKAYPVIREKNRDYRYLEYDEALNYLDDEIIYLKEWKQRDPESYPPGLLARLERTRENILSKTGKSEN